MTYLKATKKQDHNHVNYLYILVVISPPPKKTFKMVVTVYNNVINQIIIVLKIIYRKGKEHKT